MWRVWQVPRPYPRHRRGNFGTPYLLPGQVVEDQGVQCRSVVWSANQLSPPAG